MQVDVKLSERWPDMVISLSAVTNVTLIAITVYWMAVSHVAVWVILLVVTACTMVMPIQIVALGYLKKFNVSQPEDDSPSPW